MQDVTHLLERLEAFEEYSAVTFKGLYAELDEPLLIVKGEVRPIDGNQLKEHIHIVVDVYDEKGRLISRNGLKSYWPETFPGFDSFEVVVTKIATEVAKIRIYPKPGGGDY